MVVQLSIYVALFCLLQAAFDVNAFTVSPGRAVAPSSSTTRFTRLYAEEPAEGDEMEASSEDDASEGMDILSSPAFLKRKIDVLKSDISAAEAEIEELKQARDAGKAEWGDQLDQLQAEYSNIQERLGNQNKKGDSMATVQVVREMLGVLDNYDRAFGAVKPETEEQKQIEAAFKETYEEILQVFTDLGVTTVDTIGTEFDYEVHQAVMQKPGSEYEEGIVCEEFAKGFVMGDTLIRAAMVAVAA